MILAAMDAQFWITTAAILIGPIVAVGISLWFQERRRKLERKERLFEALLAYRDPNKMTQEWVHAVNLIEMVFYGKEKVISNWRTYYGMLGKSYDSHSHDDRNRALLDLLDSIAKELDYGTLRQTDIDKYYSPKGLVEKQSLVDDALIELHRVLKNTKTLKTEGKD